ncbi:MAG: hypothetical protein K2M46_06045 [Lachnospiraceae bacterium]|nr:hypothetical protein [Lachnospiraceae bacterium]
MKTLEVILLILGVGAYVASFVVPEKAGKKEAKDISEEEIKKIIQEQIPTAAKQIEEETRTQAEAAVNQAVSEAGEKTERELEKLTNEKIMAVNEYSDTVLEEIQKNHSEVMFLYSMLNDKEQEVKDTLKVINQAKAESQGFFEKTVAIVDKVDQEFDRVTNELKVYEDKANSCMEQVQAQIDEVMKKPIMAPETTAVQTPETAAEPSMAAEPVKEEESLDDTRDEEFEQKLISTLHSIIPEFDFEDANAVELGSEDGEGFEVTEEPPEKKSHFSFLKGQEKSKNEQVKELYMQGLSEVEIAQKLSIGRGEVRLIIGLMER